MADISRKKALEKMRRRTRAHKRLRKRVAGTSDCPRLAVFKSERYVYAQLIDDDKGHTLACAASSEADLRQSTQGSSGSKAAARRVGEVLAERAKQQGIQRVVFDRGGYRYHGKVKELAEAARAKGLEF